MLTYQGITHSIYSRKVLYGTIFSIMLTCQSITHSIYSRKVLYGSIF